MHSKPHAPESAPQPHQATRQQPSQTRHHAYNQKQSTATTQDQNCSDQESHQAQTDHQTQEYASHQTANESQPYGQPYSPTQDKTSHSSSAEPTSGQGTRKPDHHLNRQSAHGYEATGPS